MARRMLRGFIWAGAIAVLLIGSGLPVGAAYTKLYNFTNTTGVNQTSVKAVTNGLESITSNYSSPTGWSATTGYAVVSGVYCTTLTYAGTARGPGSAMTIGWTTADSSCRLRDLRWGGGQSIVPTQAGGIPGGGMVFYDWPNIGDLTVVITNDTEGALDLLEVEFAISSYALSLEELDALAEVGFIQLYVNKIDAEIDVLRAEVAQQGSLGNLPSPSVNSLDRKLQNAAAYKEAGLSEYLAGNLEKALFLWGKAAGHVNNFVSEVTAASQKGNLAMLLYNRWVVDGGGEIATAPEIRDALLALPEGQLLQSLEPLPCGALPAYPGLDLANCVEWPAGELQPGQFTAFIVRNIDLGAGFIMGGTVVDADGSPILGWLEQSVTEPTPIDIQPPVIVSATATPASLWPPDHSMLQIQLDVTVSDDSYAVWYIAGVTSNQPVNGTGSGDTSPDWMLDPNDSHVLWLRAERSGNDPTTVRLYTITLMAIDIAGNLSDPYDLVLPVDHDSSSG